MTMLENQLNRANKITNSEELCHTINEFPGIMEEVMDFIQEWLENWSYTYEFMCDGFTLNHWSQASTFLLPLKGQSNWIAGQTW